MEDDYTLFEDENVQHEEDTQTEEVHHPSEGSLNEQHPNETPVCQGLTDDISPTVDEMAAHLQQRIEERMSQSEVDVKSIIDESNAKVQINMDQPTVAPSPIELEVLFEDSHNNNDEEFGSLEVTQEDVDQLIEKAKDIERDEHVSSISFGKKVCPTSHGCSGATYCDGCYGDYPY